MKYKALLHNGPMNYELAELEMPPCGDDDIILKNVVASLCGSDTDTWLNGGEMHYIGEGAELGHEVACVVHEVGKNITDIKVGDRVAPFPQLVTPNPRLAGAFGGFSEYIYCTNAKYGYNLWKLDDSLSDVEAALIEPMSVSVRAADSVDVNEKTVALILGAGMIGFGVAARLVDKGVPRKNITFVDRGDIRLEKVAKEGFNAVSTRGGDWQKKAIAFTGEGRCVYGLGSNADVIYDCAGSIHPNSTEPTLMEQGMKILKLFGYMVAVGVHRRPVNINMQKLVFGLQNILCGSGAGMYHFEEGMRILASKQFNFESLVTHSYSLDDAIEAHKTSCDTDKAFKVLIDYQK